MQCLLILQEILSATQKSALLLFLQADSRSEHAGAFWSLQLVFMLGSLFCPGLAIHKVPVWCRSVLRDVVKTYSISAAVDTSYEDFHEQLQDKASKQIAEIKEPSR